jgi:Sec-independent protein translocase protein TatA
MRSVGKGLGVIRNEISSIRKQRDGQAKPDDKDPKK